MTPSFAGKSVLITGSTSGIGKSTAFHFAELGASVAVNGPEKDQTRQVVTQIEAMGGRAIDAHADVSDPAQMEAAFAAVKESFGGLDFLIGNAAIEQQNIPIEAMSVDEMSRVLDVNLKGMWLCAHYGVPLLLGRPGAAIVFISSFWSLQGGGGLSAYSAAKGGLNSLTRQLAIELGPKGIRVNCIVCGGVDTPQYQRFTHGADMAEYMQKNVPLGRVGQPEELARTIRWLCSEDASYMTAQLIGVDGGMAARMTS